MSRPSPLVNPVTCKVSYKGLSQQEDAFQKQPASFFEKRSFVGLVVYPRFGCLGQGLSKEGTAMHKPPASSVVLRSFVGSCLNAHPCFGCLEQGLNKRPRLLTCLLLSD